MPRAILYLLLLLAVGLNSPAWGISLDKASATDHGSSPLSSESGQFGLAEFAGQPADTTPTSSGTYLGPVSISFVWHSVERLHFARPFTECRTLQSQHVLLRL